MSYGAKAGKIFLSASWTRERYGVGGERIYFARSGMVVVHASSLIQLLIFRKKLRCGARRVPVWAAAFSGINAGTIGARRAGINAGGPSLAA